MTSSIAMGITPSHSCAWRFEDAVETPNLETVEIHISLKAHRQLVKYEITSDWLRRAIRGSLRGPIEIPSMDAAKFRLVLITDFPNVKMLIVEFFWHREKNQIVIHQNRRYDNREDSKLVHAFNVQTQLRSKKLRLQTSPHGIGQMMNEGVSPTEVEEAISNALWAIKSSDQPHQWVIGETAQGEMLSVSYTEQLNSLFLLKVEMATDETMHHYLRLHRADVATKDSEELHVSRGPFAGSRVYLSHERSKVIEWLWVLDRSDIEDAFAESRGGIWGSDQESHWFASEIRAGVSVVVTYLILDNGDVIVIDAARDTGKAQSTYEMRRQEFGLRSWP